MGANLLRESNNARARFPVRVDLARFQVELGLAPDQIDSWQALIEVFDEARDAIEALDAIADCPLDGHSPTMLEILRSQERRLAIRLNAVRRLHAAASRFGRALKPRQREQAERFLGRYFREIGCVSR